MNKKFNASKILLVIVRPMGVIISNREKFVLQTTQLSRLIAGLARRINTSQISSYSQFSNLTLGEKIRNVITRNSKNVSKCAKVLCGRV